MEESLILHPCFVPLLVKGMQEQQSSLRELGTIIEVLKKENEAQSAETTTLRHGHRCHIT